ncbi:hypothetical protein [Cylindrospermopsis raciborskii]|uniref:hypothetical protein n=1 Tax=Cylindrospermopsis raciborskii TaxID=77022 RepID=UPI000778A1AD|nr:hypothetical protein [Cylindrospermopsis raciborskii]MCZ2207838.1 hypothetical protein [Cylindrospermopsis raciborskii PAMP2011]
MKERIIALLFLIIIFEIVFRACGGTTLETPQSIPETTAEETTKECIDRVSNELIERDRGEVLTEEKMVLYYAEFITRCNLTPNR